MDTIGQDPQIYMMFMKMIRIVFEATPYPSLCSLRVDILMNFHDLDCEPVSVWDHHKIHPRFFFNKNSYLDT